MTKDREAIDKCRRELDGFAAGRANTNALLQVVRGAEHSFRSSTAENPSEGALRKARYTAINGIKAAAEAGSGNSALIGAARRAVDNWDSKERHSV